MIENNQAFASQDVITQQKKDFYNKHPEFIWKIYEHQVFELVQLNTALDFFINTQNGPDVDDYVLNDSSRFVSLKDQFKNKDVLIIGTGTGREMVFAKAYEANRVEGVTMGARNQMFAQEVVGVKPLIADMHMLPWDKNIFDMVIGLQVLEHSYAPIIFLLECNRVLRTNGILHIETPPSKTHTFDTWLHHILCPTPRQLFCLLIKTGFKPLEYNGIDLCSVKPEDDTNWFDDVSDNVYIKAQKMDPATYERGDMRRYYEMLAGKPFQF